MDKFLGSALCLKAAMAVGAMETTAASSPKTWDCNSAGCAFAWVRIRQRPQSAGKRSGL